MEANRRDKQANNGFKTAAKIAIQDISLLTAAKCDRQKLFSNKMIRNSRLCAISEQREQTLMFEDFLVAFLVETSDKQEHFKSIYHLDSKDVSQRTKEL